MGSIEQLKDMMSLYSYIETAEIEEYFNQIAKLLFSNLAIRKGITLYLKRSSSTSTIRIIVILSLIHEILDLYAGM